MRTAFFKAFGVIVLLIDWPFLLMALADVSYSFRLRPRNNFGPHFLHLLRRLWDLVFYLCENGRLYIFRYRYFVSAFGCH